MFSDSSTFIDQVLAPIGPPENPIRQQGWVGLAFDRNRHEDLAPTELMVGLFETHKRVNGCDVRLVYLDAANIERVEFIRSSIHGYVEKLNEGVACLADFYLLSPAKDWLVRVDYDVTLVCGEKSFIKSVVECSGGLAHFEAIMARDFYSGYEGRDDGLEKYIQDLIAPLKIA